jgi:uncharacterized membrane protein (DUF485 family)
MSQNPYPSTQRIGGDDFSGIPATSRMSVLAVVALVFGILGCVPGFGLIAILLGVAAIFLIAGSRGRVRGTGLAIGGIVLGLVFTGIYVFVAMGAVQAVQQFNQMVLVPAQTGLQGLEKGDRSGVRSLLSTTASANVTDEQIDKFAADVKAEFGTFMSIPSSLSDLWSSWANVGQAMGGANKGAGPGNQQFNNTIPWPAQFQKGQALLLLEFDPNAQGGGTLKFSNIGVAKADMSTQVWLYPKPAAGTPSPAPAPIPAPAPTPSPSPAPETPPATPPAPPSGGG